MNKIIKLLFKENYISSIFCFYIFGILILFTCRFLLMLIFHERVWGVDQFWQIFIIGLRLDIIMLSYIAILPVLLFSILPSFILEKLFGFIKWYLIFFLILLFFMEAVTPNFMIQFDTRPNRLFIEYLVYPKEVIGTLINGYLIQAIVASIVLFVFIYFLIKISSKFFIYNQLKLQYRLLFMPIVGFLVFFGVRNSLVTKRPINASLSIFSNDHFTNSLALNSLYTVADAIYSLKNEINSSQLYGLVEKEIMVDRVKKYMTVSESDFVDKNLPTMHKHEAFIKREKPLNLVIFLQESLGAEYVGCLQGLPLTPEFDKLSKEGQLFTNLFCTGTRSARGIEAVMSGYMPSPSESVLKLSGSQHDFFTIAGLLKSHGYQTSFLYGGLANFDNMASFFNGNGVDHIIDQSDLDKIEKSERGIWGYPDEVLARQANEYFKSLGDKPFFSLMFSTSNHDPFQFPDGRIELYNQPKNTVENAIKYADYSIGLFFELAKKEKYFSNTIFIIVADHNTRTAGKNLVPINKFHIPALIIGPGISESKYEKLCSQIDLAPTLLSYIGIDTTHPMVGRDLLSMNSSVQGRALMQFHDINAFRVENTLIIHQPKTKPLQFRIENDEWVLEPLNDDLVKDALSHILMANYLYSEKKYKFYQK